MREKLNSRRVTGIQCPKCHEKTWSRHRHDFRYCPCGYCYVDGGQNDYIRVGWGDESGDLFGQPITLEWEVEDDGPSQSRDRE